MKWFCKLRLAAYDIPESILNGEWWIDEFGSEEYADGDIGDKNHEMIAFESALGVNFEDVYWMIEGTAEEIWESLTPQERKELLPAANPTQSLPEDAEEAVERAAANELNGLEYSLSPLQAKILLAIGANNDAVKWFLNNSGDAREYQMRTNNWIRVVDNRFQTWRLDNDALQRIMGFIEERAAENDVGLDEITELEIMVEEYGGGHALHSYEIGELQASLQSPQQNDMFKDKWRSKSHDPRSGMPYWEPPERW